MPEPLTLTAPTITAAHRLARLLTVNALALAVLNDERDRLPPPAQQPAPNACPRPQAGVTTTDYLAAFYRWCDAQVAEYEAQGDPERHARAIIAAARAERDVKELEAALREGKGTRPGHLTRYRVTVPAVDYCHPDPAIGIHAHSEPWMLLIDTVDLKGEDLAAFKDFQLNFPARGRWPLYAPDSRDGLQKVKAHPQAENMRRILGEVVTARAPFLPQPLPVNNGVASDIALPVQIC